MPDARILYDVADTTWPAATEARLGPWLIRDGQGGGQRVSATVAVDTPTADDIAAAEVEMQALNQYRLFQIRDYDAELDQMLAERGYQIVDPVNLLVADINDIATAFPPPVTAFQVWEPLAIQIDIWAAGGIGPARLDVMRRADCVKTALLGRLNDSPAGAGYVGIHQGVAMVHALEVVPTQRRQGMAQYLMRLAAFWARDNGASHIAVLCTQANTAANALYQGLGMTLAGQYHYRKHGGDL
ncbi:GNAT family N-acetyltransferase [Thalassobius sp. Cn5-15]|nr:GNAT family N-acetyltransferase [Thalassobius sp. Cn5-15]MCG7494557.1 GNAT family N-acetyltransferase [Thalassobius sp. Cn5-15]